MPIPYGNHGADKFFGTVGITKLSVIQQGMVFGSNERKSVKCQQMDPIKPFGKQGGGESGVGSSRKMDDCFIFGRHVQKARTACK